MNRERWIFNSLNSIEQRNVVLKMNEHNDNFMFSVDSNKGYYGLKESYFDDKEVRNALNNAMSELNY